jgi:pimeloyl-ACP methyl ester carboxylesterase
VKPTIAHTEPAFAQASFAAANGITICYQAFGCPYDPALLLVDGSGCQMIEWDDEWCELLAARGYFVIRYDNRDMGLTTKFDQAGVPSPADPLSYKAPYTLADMADDGIALLGALNIPAAHIVGISMGGYIVQQMAIRHPAQVLTLTSMMSGTRNPDVPRHIPPIGPEMHARTDSREVYVETYIRWEQAIAGRYPRSARNLRSRAKAQWARGISAAGKARHSAAIAATPCWKKELAAVTAPSLIIHGDADPLVPVEAGYDTAASIPGARILIIEGWGHGYPARILWPRLINAIAKHSQRM